MDNTDKEVIRAYRVQKEKLKLIETTIIYASGNWYCPNCGLNYKQKGFIKETCDYCGCSLEKEW